MLNRLIFSRKLWEALLGSICIIVAIKLTPDAHIATAIMALGGLWGAAITGQAYKDIVQEKNDVDGTNPRKN